MPPLFHTISTLQSLWVYQSLPPIRMVWFWPISVLDHFTNFFLSFLPLMYQYCSDNNWLGFALPPWSLLHCDEVFSHTMDIPILPPLDLSLPAQDSSNRPFWGRAFLEAPSINKDKSSFQLLPFLVSCATSLGPSLWQVCPQENHALEW